MRARSRLAQVLGVGVLIVGLLVGAGCGRRTSSRSAGSTRSRVDPLYKVRAKEPTSVAIERGGKRNEQKLPPECSLFDADIIENTGAKPAVLQETSKDHRFTLAPKAKVLVKDQSIALFQGGMRLEFQKIDGEFRIVLPKSVSLGVRGTELIAVVTPDETAVVRMISGAVEVGEGSDTRRLETPGCLLIPADAAPPQLLAGPDEIPAEWLDRPEAIEVGLGDGIERVGRNRQTTH